MVELVNLLKLGVGKAKVRRWVALLHIADREGSKHTPGGYRVASATEGSLESSRRKIGVFTGCSTFEPLVMNASQSLFAAPKYPNPIAVLADA
jgi:hypothetical protein